MDDGASVASPRDERCMSAVTPDERFWEAVRETFHRVADLSTELRRSNLESCDDDVRSEVESLLAQHDGEDAFLSRSIWQMIDGGEAQSLVGTEVGPYRITEIVGTGGMGEVFLATRFGEEFTQRVAIKLVRGGRAGRAVVERFRRERKILAGLDHPNIARLLDGGTTADGLPYLVMEYVEGVSINDYCESRALSVQDRIRLFLPLCDAVQHAHQALVIHRDIKPANVLVTNDGIPKLLDFGIAKLTSGETRTDATVTRLMTPDYASPEQLAGSHVTTASDVYSLGVLLYELLTGSQPFVGTQRTADTEARNPSTVSGKRVLRGDLDRIVLTAMENDADRRYGSAERLADDLRRFLTGHPISARPASFVYRARKFVRRNRLLVAAVMLVIAVMSAGFAATLRQKRIAERRFEEVRSLARSMVFEIHDAIESLPGSTPARELLVRRALSYLDTLASEADENRSLQMELAGAYQRIGDVQGLPYRANLGDTKGALRSYHKARTLAEMMVAADPRSEEVRTLLADLHDRVGVVELRSLHMSAALEQHRTALAIRQSLPGRDLPAQLALARTWVGIADALYIGPSDLRPEERFMPAERAYENALRILVPLEAPGAERRSLLNEIGRVNQRLGSFFSNPSQLDLRRALDHHDAALRALEERARLDPSDGVARRNFADQMVMKATAQNAIGDGAGAWEGTSQALRILDALAREDPENVEAQHDLAFAYEQRAVALATLRQWGAAETSFAEALAIRQRLVAADPANREDRRGIAAIRSSMGAMYRKKGDEESATRYFAESARLLEELNALVAGR
jgi:eukaryotic-like serine/threonine-protein kinase